MIDRRLREDWIEGLRSGLFQQGYKSLRQRNPEGLTYCCLGVACQIGDPLGWGVRFDSGFPSLPIHLVEKLGLTSDEMNELILMNDCQAKSFAEIADHLESLWQIKSAPALPCFIPEES